MPRTDVATATFKFILNPEKTGLIYSALMHRPQVQLYDGKFPDPFTKLTYVAGHARGQLVLATTLGIGGDFNARYGPTMGSPEDLQPLLSRYHKHEFLDGNQRLVLYRDGQVYGMIFRGEDAIEIQRGGPAGQLALSEPIPVNDLGVHLNNHNLLVERYIRSIWKASPETNQMQLQLIFPIPQLPEGALATYFSTFENVGDRFREHPRPVILDEDIGGYPNMKALTRSLFMDLTQPDVSRRFGTQPYSNKFILVVGDEGTGKSMFPKALDFMLKARYGNEFEHFRLPIVDMLGQYGSSTAAVVETILNRVKKNEKNGIPTLLHIDNLEQLVPPHQRRGRTNPLLYSSGELPQGMQVASGAEFAYSLQTTNPVIIILREFGRELGGDSRHVVVYGESRFPREELPEGIERTFRRVFPLNPTVQDLADILRVQIKYTRKLAERTGYDPFVPDSELQLDRIAQAIAGLNGRDIQQTLLNITMKHKAEWDGSTYSPITVEELSDGLTRRLLEKGVVHRSKPPIGFRTFH